MAKQQLKIVVRRNATAMERYAAGELQKYVRLLHQFSPEITAESDRAITGPMVLIGFPGFPSCVAGSASEHGRSALSPDGFVLQTMNDDSGVLRIAGGSGRGTLFGVYELLERWGVRFTLSGDVLPETPNPLRLTGFDERVEPAYPIRAMRPLANLPEGAAAWDLPDYHRFIDQMAKLKFNTFVFAIMESGPWLDYEFRGMRRPAGDVFYGYRFPIGEDFIGKELFLGQSEFYNPILGRARDDAERKQLGIGLVRSIIQHCKSRDLMSLLTFSLLEPPTAMKHRCNEWATLPLPDSETFAGAQFTATPAEELGINPQFAAWMNVLDPSVQELTAHRLKSLINTYPDADFYHLWVSEHRASVVDSREIFQALDQKHHLAPIFDWDQALEEFATSPFERERYQNQMKGDLLFLYVLDKLLNEGRLLEQTIRPDAAIGIAGVMPQLAPIVTKILPPGATFVQFLDYGSHGTADHVNRLAPLLQAGVPTTLEIGIHDDNNMYFPQANVESLERIVKATAGLGMKGYVTALWQVRQCDISAAYLGRVSWQPNFTASEFYQDFLPKLVGPAAADEFEKAQRMLESADRQIRKSVLYGYAFVFNENVIKSFLENGVNREEIDRIQPQFRAALDHFRSAQVQASAGGAPHVEFWIKRTQFAVDWLEFAMACADIGKGLKEARFSGLERSKAFDALLDRSRRLIELIASDAGHLGDLGQIANMNQHVQHYLEARRDAS